MRKFRHDISIIPPKDVRFSGKSLSEYELILALIEKVNELIKYTNSVAELVYALEKWINDEFINAIDESTKKTLIEWRESGYLQELVEDYLVNLTVAISELLDEEEQKFEKSWHPIFDTKMEVEEIELYGKTYNKYTFKKGVSNDIFTITRVSISERQTHDSYVELFNLGKGFRIKDAISGKYVNVEEYEELSPEIDALPIKKYKLRNVYANLTFELDEDVDQIEVILFNSSIRSKVNIDEGFIWLVSRMDKLEDDMVIFEQWVREFVTTKITELENKVNKQIDDTIEYVDEEILKNKNYVDSELVKNKNYVDQEVTKNKNYVDQEVTNTKNYVDSELPKKLDKEWLKKSPNVLNPVMQMLAYRGGDYVSVQGSCVIGNKIVIGYIAPSSTGTELGVLVEYDMDTGAVLRTSSPMKIYHANGMDYNPKTDRIYISHANQQNPSGNNNDVSEVNYSTFKHVGVITPSNIPSGRRVKGYSYDKHTGKQYLNDDKGFYEVDSNFNVIKVIDFEPYFFRSVDGGFGLGQHVTVNNDIAYFVTTGPMSIHAFDMKGTLLKSWNIPEISQEGFWRGEEIQSMTFDTDNVAYLTSRYGITDVTTNQTIIQVQSLDFTRNRVTDTYPYTANPRTAKTLHVDPNSQHPRPDGRSHKPFRDLNMAIDFARRNRLGYNTIISLADGTYGNVEVQGNGEKIRLVGNSGVKENVIIRGLRCYYMDIELRNLTVKRNVKSYAYSILSQGGTLLLNGVIVDGNRDGNGTGVQTNFGTVIAHNGQGNRFLNCDVGINANGSLVLGNIPSFGLGNVPEPVKTSSTAYTPLI